MSGRVGLYFILPAMLVLLVLIAYPVIYTGYLSATDPHGALTGKNFVNVLRPAVTTQAFFNTIYWVAGSIVFQVILGTLSAILLNQNFWGRSVVRAITLIPWVVPGIVAATTWAWMLHTDFGIINYMLTSSDIVAKPIGWLTNRDTVMPALIAVNVWKLFPFVAIMVLAGLQAIPADLYEAAKMDGASFWEEVWFVTLPQVRPVLVAVTLLLVIWALNSITLIFAMTGGGPANRSMVTPIQIFHLAFDSFQFNQAAALSVVFFAVTLVIVVIYVRVVPQNPGGAK
jgi:multiple sugar transport system permease protein